MYPVSQEFIDKIKADERQVFAKIQIDYTDPFLDQSLEVEVNENANVSFPEQTADAVAEPFAKIASLDGSWVLDGTYTLAPTPQEAETKQMGWWGSQLAGTGGVFVTPYPTLTVSFFPRPITRLQAVGDSKRQEWPVDFNIKLYDGNNTLLHTETVTGNTEIAWSKVLDEAVTQVEKMTLEIHKWSHEGRQAKILEFFTSIQETYEGDDILLVHLLEEREVSQGSLPIGNISSNEIDIRLSNETRKFDAGNKVSSLYQLLKANRRIKAWIGTEGELIPLGVFWSGDWNVPEDNVYAATTGRDRLELLRKSTYSTSKVEQDTTLYELAEIVLQNAGLTEDEYWIDEELQEYQIPYAYFTAQSHREALRKIAEACLGQVYCDREGILRIEGPSFMEDKIAELTDTYFLEGAFPAEVEGIIEAYGIGPDDYFRKDNPVKWSEIANYIEVETQPLKPDVEQEIYRSDEPLELEPGQAKTITIFYNESPAINTTFSLDDGVNLDIMHIDRYAWGANIKIVNTGEQTDNAIVIARGRPLKIINKERVVAKDENSITDNGMLKYTFPGNPLVQTRTVAQRIANKLLAYYKDPRRDIEIDWRGNPALLLGDIILTPDYQRSGEDQRGLFYVTKQELEYNGALRAKLSGRRAL